MSGHDYLTTAEVAAYLRLKERTIYDLVARKAIPCSRVTGKLIFPRRLIDRWVEANIEMAGEAVAAPPPIVAGSSDPLLEWAVRESGSGLATLFEGSDAGLRRLAEGSAVAVGLHLLNPDGEGFNTQAVKALAAVHDIVLIEWAGRDQGLVVARGNPLGIAGIEDLAAKAPRIAGRQAGAGARLLLESLLEKAGIAAAELAFTGRSALTEADVAAAVADGEADCGLAVGASARRYGLDFVPLARERFDLACRRRDFFEPPLQTLFAFVREAGFAARAATFGAYDVTGTGRVRLNA